MSLITYISIMRVAHPTAMAIAIIGRLTHAKSRRFTWMCFLLRMSRHRRPASDALKVYSCNVATQRGETDGFSVTDHLTVLQEHLNANPFHFVVVHVDGTRINVEVVAADWGRGFAPYRSRGATLADPVR